MPRGLVERLETAGYAVALRRHVWVEALVQGHGEVWVGRGQDEAEALRHAASLMCPSHLAQQVLSDSGSWVPSETAPASFPALVRKESPEPMDPERSREWLEILSERIRDQRLEAAWCSAERQRLAIMSWICEARAHTERFPEDLTIREQVSSISRTLTEMGKAYWPGSVTALQLSMQPKDLPRHLLGGVANTWGRAAEMSEAALGALESSSRGRDAYGYADSAALDPPPADPDGLLNDLVEELTRRYGNLERSAEPEFGRDTPPEPEAYQKWVRTVRWLRMTSVDPDTWARVLGRLRWWNNKRSFSGVPEVDPDYTPDRPWAELLDAPRGESGPILGDEALARLRERLDGTHMLFVGPRREPEMQARLTDMLPNLRLEYKLSDPLHLRSLGEAIQAGQYQVVVGALGLQSAEMDRVLALACRRGSVPYLRVHFCDVRRCLQGLRRQADRVPVRTVSQLA